MAAAVALMDEQEKQEGVERESEELEKQGGGEIVSEEQERQQGGGERASEEQEREQGVLCGKQQGEQGVMRSEEQQGEQGVVKEQEDGQQCQGQQPMDVDAAQPTNDGQQHDSAQHDDDQQPMMECHPTHHYTPHNTEQNTPLNLHNTQQKCSADPHNTSTQPPFSAPDSTLAATTPNTEHIAHTATQLLPLSCAHTATQQLPSSAPDNTHQAVLTQPVLDAATQVCVLNNCAQISAASLMYA